MGGKIYFRYVALNVGILAGRMLAATVHSSIKSPSPEEFSEHSATDYHHPATLPCVGHQCENLTGSRRNKSVRRMVVVAANGGTSIMSPDREDIWAPTSDDGHVAAVADGHEHRIEHVAEAGLSDLMRASSTAIVSAIGDITMASGEEGLTAAENNPLHASPSITRSEVAEGLSDQRSAAAGWAKKIGQASRGDEALVHLNTAQPPPSQHTFPVFTDSDLHSKKHAGIRGLVAAANTASSSEAQLLKSVASPVLVTVAARLADTASATASARKPLTGGQELESALLKGQPSEGQEPVATAAPPMITTLTPEIYETPPSPSEGYSWSGLLFIACLVLCFCVVVLFPAVGLRQEPQDGAHRQRSLGFNRSHSRSFSHQSRRSMRRTESNSQDESVRHSQSHGHHNHKHRHSQLDPLPIIREPHAVARASVNNANLDDSDPPRPS